MLFEKSTSRYNDRRYGEPYIAVMSFEQPSKPEPRWGTWIGQAGCSGLLQIEAEPGDILMIGQRDNRNMRNSAPDYYQLQADGTLSGVLSKADAYRAWRENRTTPATDNPLAAYTGEQIMAEAIRRGILSNYEVTT